MTDPVQSNLGPLFFEYRLSGYITSAEEKAFLFIMNGGNGIEHQNVAQNPSM